ncbi:MAG: hypothetical protein NE330_11585 [Lentisphaeraceae bacterium]|nr:hypothetical protein [Lentisphaeraceae bacterium]
MDKYLEQVKNGWNILNGRKSGKSTPETYMLFAAALLQAICCWVIASFFTYFFSEKISIASETVIAHTPYGVALVASILLIIFNAICDKGKNLNALSWFGEFAGKWQEEYYESTELCKHYNVLFINAIILCKVLCMTMLIASGQVFWVIYVFTLGYCSYIATASKTDILKGKAHADIEVYTICGIFLLISCVMHRHLIPVLIATAAAYLIQKFATKKSIEKIETVNDEINRTISQVVVCVSLIIGILFIR